MRPYLLYTGQEKTNTFVATNTVIPITAPAEGIFKATFQLLAGIDAKDKLILVDHDDTQAFLKATDKARIPAFRAFLGTDTEAELLVNHAFGDITSIKGLQKHRISIYPQHQQVVSSSKMAQIPNSSIYTHLTELLYATFNWKLEK